MKKMRRDALAVSVPGERYTPFALAKKLGALAILESASFTHGRDRYSIILAREAFRVIQNDAGVHYAIDGKNVPAGKGDILDVLMEIAGQNALPADGIPLPGAGIGYLGYEFCQRTDTITLAEQQ